MNSAMENKTNHIHEDKEKEKEFLRDIKTDKGDIDDYIFSWQTVKMFSERWLDNKKPQLQSYNCGYCIIYGYALAIRYQILFLFLPESKAAHSL